MAATKSKKSRAAKPAAKSAKRASGRAAKPAAKRASPARPKARVRSKAKAPAKAAKRSPIAVKPRPVAKAVPARPAPRTTPVESLRWTETLRDGSHVIIRPIGKKDIPLERAFIERLSPESRRMRFLGQVKQPSEDLLRKLTDIDYRRDMAFIALVHRDGQTQEVGVSRYSTSADGKSCECAVTVSDDWHNKGLATLLMRHLIDVARSRGIRSMVSYDAIDNGPMRELAGFLGFERKADPEDRRMVVHRLDL